MEYQRIVDFSPGLNTVTDERRLKPNNEKEGSAESPEMLNMDITKTGALITSPGFEKVSGIVGTGGVKSLLVYDKDATDRYLIIAHDDDYYSITPSATPWSTTNLGSYGTAGDLLGGTVYLSSAGTRKAILGTDVVANTIQKADLSAVMTAVVGGPPDGYIMAVFMGRLFVAGLNSHTLYYTNVDDEDDWAGGGSIGFNDIITGLQVEGERLVVFTRTYHQGVKFTYDDTWNLSVPLKEPYERKYGASGYKAITNVGSNVKYWGHDNRVYNLGTEEGRDDSGLPRPMPISRQIDPSLALINKSARQKAVAVELEDKEEWWLSVPYDTSEYNSLTFVYNINWDSWSTRYGFYPSDIVQFRDSNYELQTYFGDALSPNLYQFNDEYSYDGAGYIRRWKSKVFTMGDNSIFKEWRWIDISGSMWTTTEFTVRITVDNQYKEYVIDNTHLVVDAFGEYIGDNNIGDVLIGGSEPAEGAFKRFKAHIPVPTDLREGFEIQLSIYNDEPQQPWKIDELGIEYDYRPRGQRKQSFINNNPK